MPSTEKQQLNAIYNDIQDCVHQIHQQPSGENLAELRTLLNKFFNSSNCRKVIYTPNTDKLFFGIYVFPHLIKQDIVEILFKQKRYIVSEYTVELDSKLFGGYIGLTDEEITALLIHDVAHLVNNSAPALEVRKAIDKYLVDANDVLRLPPSIHYSHILAFGFADAMRKTTTIFEKEAYKPDDITDEFIDWCDFTGLIISAFNKIQQIGYNYNREVKDKFIILSWVLRIYRDIKHNRIPVLMTVRKATELTPSKIEAEELKKLARHVSRIDDDSLIQESAAFLAEELDYEEKKTLDDIIDNSRSTITGSIVNDYESEYDYNVLEIEQNVEDNDAMLDLLNSINTKMSILQHCADNAPMTQAEFDQLDNIYRRYGQMRADLCKGNLFHHNSGMINTYTSADDV